MAEGFARETPGQMLREAREARGRDLDAAHEGTKIPLRLLEAIERDEYHKLSGPLYVRSFLRNYAGWLGIDVDAVLRAYESVAGRPDSGAGDDMTWNEEVVVVRRVGSPWRRDVVVAVIAVVVTVVIAIGIWRMLTAKGDADSGPPAGASPPSSSDAGAAIPADMPRLADTTRTEAAARPAAGTTRPREAGNAAGKETAAARLARLSRDTLVAAHAEAATPTRGSPPAPAPLPATADVPFAAGTPINLVLRVTLPGPTNCSVRCDTQPAARPVIWPDRPRPLPDRGVEPGTAYAVRGGYAVYWGASDTFTLTLGDLEGAGAMLNGVALPVDRWQQGQPVVLDAHTLARIGG